MTRLQLFTRLQLIPLLIFITLFLLSFFDFYWTRWGYFLNMWYVIFYYVSYGEYFESFIVSLIHFISIILTFILFLISGKLVKKYTGYPSIKDASKYFKELKRVKKASLKAKALNEFKTKLAELEQEKKKYL